MLNDNLQEIFRAQAAIRADRCAKRHHGSGACLLQSLAQDRISLAIGQHDEAQLHQFLRRFQRFNRVGQQVARIGMDLQFQPVGAESLAGHLCGEDRLLGVAHTGGIGQELDMLMRDVAQHIILRIL